MTNTPTSNFGYDKPAPGDRGWGAPTLNDNLDAIDADLATEHRSDTGNHGKHGPKVTITQTGNDNVLIVTKTDTGTADTIVVNNSGSGWDIKGTTGAWGVTQDGIIVCMGITGVSLSGGATGVQGQTGIQGATGVQGVTGIGATGVQGDTGVGTAGSQGATGLQGVTGLGGSGGLQAAYDNGQTISGSTGITITQNTTRTALTLNQTSTGNQSSVLVINNSSTNSNSNSISVNNTGPALFNSVGISINSGATTTDQTGCALAITGRSTILAVAPLVSINKGYTSFDTTTGSVVLLKQSSDASSECMLKCVEEGVGGTLGVVDIQASYSGNAAILLHLQQLATNANSSAVCLTIDNASTTASNAVVINHSSSGSAVTLNKKSTTAGDAITITNSGSGNGIQINNSSTGTGILINQNGTGGSALSIGQSPTSAYAMNITSAGYGQYINLTGSNGTGLYITTNASTIEPSMSYGLLRINKIGTGSSPAMIVQNSGSGISISVSQSNTTSPGLVISGGANTLRVGTARTVTNSTDSGTIGDICWDSGYIYVCVDTNVWKRATLATW
jgi:hypothetical protein